MKRVRAARCFLSMGPRAPRAVSLDGTASVPKPHALSASNDACNDGARMVPVERRERVRQRCGAMLRKRGRFTDTDVADVAQLALTGLAHQPAA